ncbi:MAG TPA: UDP-2,3-diacylglucosamine diphosphatase LpxI [Terriglobia bacterium]|nr:UDP-2,3-diacylglucosamine diphosphatase LpxI [Terriglobia bacterium]
MAAESPIETAAPVSRERMAVIAGNGRFPFLVLGAAREQGLDPVVFAIREEASSELAKEASTVHWLSLGEAARFFELLDSERVGRVTLAGQVKHVQLYSSIPPDAVMKDTLDSLERRNTDALIGVFVKMMEARGIEVVDSTLFLKPLLPEAGVLTARRPDETESADIEYGREIARRIAALDIGQTVVVAERACVAVEAMEGTDAAIERAGRLGNGRRLTVVKVSKGDMRFDVPVVGLATIRMMDQANARSLAIDARRTLLFDRQHLIEEADRCGIAIVALAVSSTETL